MDRNTAQQYVKDWFNRLPAHNDIPLFKVQTDAPTVVVLHEGLVKYSDAFRNHLDTVGREAGTDFNAPARPRSVEGALYMVYTRCPADNTIVPRYIGMASIHGKTDGMSALFAGKHPEIRFNWRLNSKGHIGNLNEARSNPNHAYANWVHALFAEPVGNPPLLRTPVYVSMELWDMHSASTVPILGHMSLETEEMIRIDLLRQADRADSLLNKIANHNPG
jgi:hypothetical protein